jgi:mono/diheme cytochrome c family protein
MRVWLVQLSFVLVLSATGVPASQEVQRTVWDGVFTDEQAARGAVIYRQACRKCHYADLSGAGDPDASPGEVPPGLVGVAFSDYWQELSIAELFLAIARGMPGDRPGTLTPQATADVVSYILQRNAFPAGSNELPAEPGLLERILIADQP